MENGNSSNIIDLNLSLQEKETEIELLQETFTEIGSELDLEKIFQIVSQRARELINAETVLIPLLDDNCKTYTYRGGEGKNAREIVGESLPLEFGVCGWVWKHKKPWWQGMLDELSDDEKNRWEQEVGHMILVPLQGKRRFLGGIAGLNKIDGGGFGTGICCTRFDTHKDTTFGNHAFNMMKQFLGFIDCLQVDKNQFSTAWAMADIQQFQHIFHPHLNRIPQVQDMTKL